LRQFLLLPPPERLVRPLRDAIPVVQWLYGETFAQEDVQSQCAISKVGQQPRHLQLVVGQ